MTLFLNNSGLYQKRRMWALIGMLMLVVIIPTVCLLWFVSEAVRNENMAVPEVTANENVSLTAVTDTIAMADSATIEKGNAEEAVRPVADVSAVTARAPVSAQAEVSEDVFFIENEAPKRMATRLSDITREAEKKAEATESTAAEPTGGRKEFNNYVSQNLHYPDEVTGRQRHAVVLSFTVNADSSISGFNVISSPGEAFSREAIRVIKEGPAWNPAYENGKPVEEEVRIRLVFR